VFEPDETTEQLRRLANAIDQRGLNEPAILLLVAARPFRYMLSQLMVITAPFFGWSSALGTSRFSWLLEDKEPFDQLISMLEESTRCRHSEAGND
jgi:hypothetical protein